ncbi:type II restriction endonuclease [Capnocytophaga sputigena]|uniref:Type-2 restriction enzyme n=1 Tax=Capnocytophaga sputigena TaxID=1019 RepID=A0AAX2ID43_CAPSP|nr:type II restriction endonuclease [Capnocytophaga sputigena]ATA84310.1 restriction endonuclease [Capnocytophaga sputigena]EEB65647.1 DpmII restriction endonuclease [Capnocytophaga sputigena ATCC 33612]SQA75938.1 Type-2 restriction enzyme MboI [Capnocytophaga sputigena]
MKEQFKTFLSQLSETNATLDYFVDFQKVIGNVRKIALKLNQLNYLIGKDNLEEAINELYEENPKVFEVLDILIAVRNKNTKTLDNTGKIVSLENYFSSPKSILEYICETRLVEVFKNKEITNLVDYVFGIEVGLDTNARKNRGGDNMSKAVSLLFDREEVYYKKEVNSTLFLDIESLGVDVKRFDFVIKTKKKTYLIETNFYNTGGSKLNEVARAYSEVAPKINQYENYEFVWITDGQGWFSAKNKLEEAYNIIPNVYNLTTLSEFVEKVKKEESIKF